MRIPLAFLAPFVVWGVLSHVTPGRQRNLSMADDGPRVKAPAVVPQAAAETSPWLSIDGNGFRVWHTERALAERVLARAEESRRVIVQAWFPRASTDEWQPLCDIYLCSDGREFGIGRSETLDSPGHALVVKDGQHVLRRKIVLQASHPLLLDAVIPHEVAHIVTRSYWHGKQLPHWADEGIAMLCEPEQRQETYRAELIDFLSQSKGMTSREILGANCVSNARQPAGAYAGAYALSFYLVENAEREAFLRLSSLAHESDQLNFLRETYGLGSFGELDAAVNKRFNVSNRSSPINK